MKRIYIYLLALSIASCSSPNGAGSSNNKGEATEEVEEAEEMEEAPEPEPSPEEATTDKFNLDDFKGFYVGQFKADKFNGDYIVSYYNKINISIDSFSESLLYGHSVVAGNDRPFKGQYSISEGIIKAECAEPGDDRYDGKFDFEIRSPKLISGTWIANNKKITVYQRKYDLTKASFNYDPKNTLSANIEWSQLYDSDNDDESGMTGEFTTKDVTKFNPSVQTLKAGDIENMYKGDLEIMRNSIYARHGYSFKNRKMRYVFDKYVDWYIPVSTDVRDQLTTLELANIELIKRYEEHAEKYYDSFGR